MYYTFLGNMLFRENIWYLKIIKITHHIIHNYTPSKDLTRFYTLEKKIKYLFFYFEDKRNQVLKGGFDLDMLKQRFFSTLGNVGFWSTHAYRLIPATVNTYSHCK